MKTNAQSTTEVVEVLPSSPEPTPSIEMNVDLPILENQKQPEFKIGELVLNKIVCGTRSRNCIKDTWIIKSSTFDPSTGIYLYNVYSFHNAVFSCCLYGIFMLRLHNISSIYII